MPATEHHFLGGPLGADARSELCKPSGSSGFAASSRMLLSTVADRLPPLATGEPPSGDALRIKLPRVGEADRGSGPAIRAAGASPSAAAVKLTIRFRMGLRCCCCLPSPAVPPLPPK